MPGHIPVMIGTLGLSDREFFVLSEHAPVTVGRSRSCDVCFYRFRKYLALPEAERAKVEKQYAMIGRFHLRISLTGTVVRCESLSAAGTTANGQRLVEPITHDLSLAQLVLRLATLPDTFTLRLLQEQEVEEKLIPSQMPASRGQGGFAGAGEDSTPHGSPALVDPKAAPAVKPSGPIVRPSGPVVKPVSAPAAAASVTFALPKGGKRTVPVPPGSEMLALLESAGAACAERGCGMGSCHTCKLRAVSGRANVTSITEHDDSGLSADEFLPCCSSTSGPVEVVKA